MMTGFAWIDVNVSEAEIREAWHECNGDARACAHRLHIGYKAMAWHIERLQLRNPKPGAVVASEMSQDEFVALVRGMRRVPFLRWLRMREKLLEEMTELLRKLVDDPFAGLTFARPSKTYSCDYCGATEFWMQFEHADDCPIARARALVKEQGDA